MNYPSTWTTRELFLLETMATRIKLARKDQLEAIWAHAPTAPAPFSLPAALYRLSDLIECYTVNLAPPLRPTAPLFSLSPDDERPDDLLPLSRALRARWKGKPGLPTTVFVPSRKAANLFGNSTAGLPAVEHRDHDALLTDVFLLYLKRQPERICEFVGEGLLGKAGYRIKDPDAFFMSAGAPHCVIESGGAYSVKQLAGLCDYAQQRDLFLEIW